MVKRIFTPVDISILIRSLSPSAASRSSSTVLARSTRRPMTWEWLEKWLSTSVSSTTPARLLSSPMTTTRSI
ncbi:hypothetical protein D3C84_1268060 [compost metagenome]